LDSILDSLPFRFYRIEGGFDCRENAVSLRTGDDGAFAGQGVPQLQRPLPAFSARCVEAQQAGGFFGAGSKDGGDGLGDGTRVH